VKNFILEDQQTQWEKKPWWFQRKGWSSLRSHLPRGSSGDANKLLPTNNNP